MATLLDIVPATATEVVKINGQRFVVHGLRVPALASIVARFPDLGFLIGAATANIGMPRMIEQLGAATGPIIAAGIGELGNEKTEKIAGDLLAEHQLELVAAIFRVTFPNGFISFVQKLGTLMSLMAGAHEGEQAKPVTVRRAKRSPSPSPPSSDADSRPTMQ
jgi:hypothetical protein